MSTISAVTFVSAPARAISREQSLWCHAAVVAALVVFFLFTRRDMATLSLGGASICCLYLWLGVNESRRQQFWLTPLSFFFYWYSVGYGLSAIWAAWWIHSEGELPLLNQIVPGADVASGYLLMLIGAVSLHAGYIMATQWARVRALPEARVRPHLLAWSAAFLLGVVALVRPQPFLMLGLAHILFEMLAPAVLLSFACLDRRNFQVSRAQYAACLGCGTALLFAASIYYGAKSGAMLSLLPLFSALVMRRRFRVVLPFGLAAVVVLYLGVIAPMINESRSIAWTASQAGRLQSALEEKTALAGADEELYSDQLDSFFYRQFEPTAVGFIYSEVNARGYLYGETMKPLAYVFVPRILWPDKPVISRGTWFTAYLGFSGSAEEATTNTGTYAAGEFYWNFGVAGVVLGMLLLGALFGTIYKIVGEGPHPSIVAAVFFYIAVTRMVDMGSATEKIPELVFVLLALWGVKMAGQVLHGRRARFA